MTILKTGIFFVLVPVICLAAVPIWLILTTPVLFSFWIFRWLAFPCWLVGWMFMILCSWQFATRGEGTPNPLDPPRQLVVDGLYGYVRNPIYFGATAVLLGYVLWHPALPILLMPLIGTMAWVLFVHLYEEPHLRKTFGAAYEHYCSSVPRWIPRFR